VKWFKDKFTGRTMNRPGMDQLMEQLRSGRLERIVVWRLDRLGRTTNPAEIALSGALLHC
jgi:DNA invertase Pin-like site-specific DNA recombinase